MVKDLIGRSESNYKSRCLRDEGVIEARDCVPRQSVDIAIDVTRLSVEFQGEQDGGKNKDKIGPADTRKVPAAVMPNIKMKIAANKLGEKIGPADMREVPGAVMPNFKMKIAANGLGDKTGIADQLGFTAAVQLNFKMKIATNVLGDNGMIGMPNKVSAQVLEVPEAFEAQSG